jgi:hypothetical protein
MNMIDPATLDRDCFYWVLGLDGEPEPARWSGLGWATIGGREIENIEVLSCDPIEFTRQRRPEMQRETAVPFNISDHLRF